MKKRTTDEEIKSNTGFKKVEKARKGIFGTNETLSTEQSIDAYASIAVALIIQQLKEIEL